MSHKHAPRGPLKLKDHMDGPDHMDAPTCTATAKGSGQRCKRRPIPGGTVCVKHGGGAPQVQMKAKERLSALFPKSVMVIDQLLGANNFPTVQFQAAKFIAEQEVGRAKETTEVTVKGVGEMTDEELRAKALELAGAIGG